MAGGISDAVVDEVKGRIDLADLISSYGVNVRQTGGRFMACCPFHQEKTPSFSISPEKGFYHCFGCGESGDAIKFVEKMEGLSFVDAVRKLADRCGVKIEEKVDPEAARRGRLYALMAELAAFYHRCLLKMKEAAVARDYLAKRELDEKVQEEWLVGYAPNGVAPIIRWGEKYGYTPEEIEAAGVIKGPSRPGDQGYHRFGGRLMFTIRDKRGRVVAFSGRQLVERKNSGKYVNSPETAIFKKSNVLFGFDKAAGEIVRAPHREIICCEGQIDTIRLHASGFRTAVGSQGTAFTEEHARMVKRVADAAVLMYDDDSAGHKATVKVARMLLAMEMPVRVVALPGGDDPDSFLRTHPASDMQALMDGAESIVSFQHRVERAKEARPDSIDAVSRVSKALLATIAACPSAVLRASLVNEASRLLGIPAASLAEELSRTKVEPFAAERRTAAERAPEGDFDPVPDEASSADGFVPPETQPAPPPIREKALMAFLMANEYDRTLDGMIGSYLPPETLSHDFSRRFVATWRNEAAKGEDMMGAFADALGPVERGWFDSLLEESVNTEASALSATDILEDFVRSLWIERLKRDRGGLPASGGAEADERRMKISMDIKRFRQSRWRVVKEMIEDFKTKEIAKGQ